ncbi:MAG: hypothetical protein ACK40V_03985 [Anaerolineales bacterium]
MPQILFNGRTYNSLEEMPPKMRQAHQQIANLMIDKNDNGIPNFWQGDIVKNISNIYAAASSIDFNGLLTTTSMNCQAICKQKF